MRHDVEGGKVDRKKRGRRIIARRKIQTLQRARVFTVAQRPVFLTLSYLPCVNPDIRRLKIKDLVELPVSHFAICMKADIVAGSFDRPRFALDIFGNYSVERAGRRLFQRDDASHYC